MQGGKAEALSRAKRVSNVSKSLVLKVVAKSLLTSSAATSPLSAAIMGTACDMVTYFSPDECLVTVSNGSSSFVTSLIVAHCWAVSAL
jgi:hypothetical protein